LNWRDVMCGEVRSEHVGQRLTLAGWADSRRDHGGLVFVDLRDRTGICQLVLNPERAPEAARKAHAVRNEFVLRAEGEVVPRAPEAVNPNIATGEVELQVDTLEIVSTSTALPFQLDEEGVDETLRLRYRWLDLRRPKMQRNIGLRSRLVSAIRRTMEGGGFLEIETPILFKPTPEGARDFIVPSRLQPGRFFALPQSPQILKQLLVIGGFDRYFQIARCFRDEDLRADRVQEITQLDVEMAFPDQEFLFALMETMAQNVWRDCLGVELEIPFPRMSWHEADVHYGSDKPDLRFDLPLFDLTEVVRKHQGGGVELLRAAIATPSHIVKGWKLPAAVAEAAKVSRTDIDKLEEYVKGFGARGLARARVAADGTWTQSPMKTISEALRSEINAAAGAKEGDLLFFQFGSKKLVNAVLGGLRLHLAQKYDLIPKGVWKFAWITDFPLFEEGDGGHMVAAHHPFTSPVPEDLERLESDPGSVRARAYDLVLNGNEIAGGSIRIHRADVQARVFRALGLSEADAQAKFGFLLEAFKYGPPPHGGIAAGVDRLAMLLCGADSLRDVIAFPKTQKGTDLLSDAPSAVAARQLDELHIALKE